MKPRHLFASDALRCLLLTQYLTHPCSLSFKLASENHSAQAFTHRIREFQCSWSGRWSDLLIHCAILVRVSCAELKRQCDKPIAGNWTLHSGQVTLMNFSLKTPQYLNACVQSAVLQSCIVRVSRYTLGVQQISLGMQRGGRQGRAVLHVQSTELRSQLQRTQQAESLNEDEHGTVSCSVWLRLIRSQFDAAQLWEAGQATRSFSQTSEQSCVTPCWSCPC